MKRLNRRVNIMVIPSEHCFICDKWHQKMTFIEAEKNRGASQITGNYWYKRIFVCKECKRRLMSFWSDKK